MRPRWLIVALVVSVALNLFLIGAGAGVVVLAKRIARQNPTRPAALVWATQGLPQPERRDLRLKLFDMRMAVRPQTERSRALRLQAWGALAEAKPDAAAIKQGLAESRQIDIGVRTTVENQIVDDVLALPPPDRATFAAGMRAVLTAPPRARPSAEVRPPRS